MFRRKGRGAPAVLCVLCVLPLLGACSPGCDIISAGVFERQAAPSPDGLQKSGLDATHGLLAGRSGVRISSETDELEARLGRGFGFQYALMGLIERDHLSATVLHPVMKRPDGSVTSSLSVPWNTGLDSITWWFERREELLPGEWTLRIDYKGRELCAKTFHIRVPYL